METFLVYTMKSGVAMFLFYGVYLLLLKKSTHFKLNRFYLLSTFIFSIVLPFIQIDLFTSSKPQVIHYMLKAVEINQIESIDTAVIPLYGIISWAYLLVLSGLLLWLIIGLVRIIHIYVTAIPLKTDEVTIHKTAADHGPFSFFTHVFIPSTLIPSPNLNQIVEHELVHVRQGHSLDALLVDVISAVIWFNPMVWIYRASIKETHEYLADQGVISKGYHPVSYKQMILESAIGSKVLLPVNSFNRIKIKNRLIMINKLKPSRFAALKLVAVLPVVAFLFYSFSNPVTSIENSLLSLTEDIAVESYALTLNELKDDTVYAQVDEMPVFSKGGNDGLRMYIAQNIKYPASARDKGIQASIFVSFVINKKGKVENVELIRAKSYILDGKKKVNTSAPELEEESLRVVKSLPDFTPGKQNGKPVSVKMTVPINYKLDGKKKDKKNK